MYETGSCLECRRRVRERPVRQLRRTDDTIAEPERQDSTYGRAARTPAQPPIEWKRAKRRGAGDTVPGAVPTSDRGGAGGGTKSPGREQAFRAPTEGVVATRPCCRPCCRPGTGPGAL